MGDPWNPDQYLRFRDERKAPWLDLVAMLKPMPSMLVYDLGCGPGELTRELHQHLGARETVGIDSSADMLDRATAHAGEGVRFVHGDVSSLDASGVDLIFSNATFHLLPDHPRVLERWTRALAPGGQIALQFPANYDHPSHYLADEVAAEAPFAAALGGYQRGPCVLDLRAYDELLHHLGHGEKLVTLRIYGHELADAASVVEWVKGSVLTAYEGRLSGDLFEAFVARYASRLRSAIGDDAPYYYTYKRILLWARRGD